MKTKPLEEKIEEILQRTVFTGMGLGQHKEVWLPECLEAISNLVEEEVKRALSDLQTRRYNHKCICCTSNFDNIAFKIKELSNE